MKTDTSTFLIFSTSSVARRSGRDRVLDQCGVLFTGSKSSFPTFSSILFSLPISCPSFPHIVHFLFPISLLFFFPSCTRKVAELTPPTQKAVLQLERRHDRRVLAVQHQRVALVRVVVRLSLCASSCARKEPVRQWVKKMGGKKSVAITQRHFYCAAPLLQNAGLHCTAQCNTTPFPLHSTTLDHDPTPDHRTLQDNTTTLYSAAQPMRC